ncbi:AAA family ATPase [Paraburkholderia dipogonis]|jgi:ABC-type branched-subunit amino acid transport system ATPase component|uniref:AAA family ATPase n=1 Tax=Paraburkholderia dipogonis TaxID=1211383 RepID=UPI0038BB6405
MAPNGTAEDVRLEQLEIKGYRSCLSTSFAPDKDLSALIGVNGAGKTNILQAVRLLNSKQGRFNKRALEQLGKGADSEVTAWFRLGGNDKRIGLRMRFSIMESTRRDELVAVSEAWNLQSITGSKSWRNLPPIEFFRDSAKAQYYQEDFFLFNGEARFGQVSKMDIDRSGIDLMRDPTIVDAVSSIADFRAGITYYSASRFTDPVRCPSSFEVDEDGRLADSYGSSAPHLRFIYDLYRLKVLNEALYDAYCRFVSRQQLGLLSRITWKEIELSSSTAEVRSGGGVKKVRKRKTLVIPKVQIGSSYITFNQLSEGTFKTLALAFYIITDSSRLLMVEEPEVCVHHGLLSRVVDTLKAYSKTKQTFISTHSDLLVDQLETENIFVVEMARNGTQVKQLDNWLTKDAKRALHTYLAETGSLGEYWRSGGLS